MNPTRRICFVCVVSLIAVLAVSSVARAQSLSNFSARVDIAPGGNYIMGFAVPGPNPATLLLRAVGTPLQQFGINNGVTAPDMQIFDSKGMEFGFSYIPEGAPNFPALFAQVGAFALTGGGAVYTCGPFWPGTYTVKLSDDSGVGGTLLFELYVVTGAVPLNTPALTTTIVVSLPTSTFGG
jgi:hypothetical protein